MRTNKRLLKITYDYFLANEIIEHDKSKKFNQFMVILDLLIYYKSKASKRKYRIFK